MPSGSSIHISIRPQRSVAGARMMRTPGCGQPGVLGVDIRTWIQIITVRPGGPAAGPEASGSPGPGKDTSPGSSGGPDSRKMARPRTSR
jgi:hypothetical protein